MNLLEESAVSVIFYVWKLQI